MALVVDASVAVRWLFDMTDIHQADDILQSEEPLIAPDLVIAEITSAAWKFVRFEGLNPNDALSIIAESEGHFDEIVPCLKLKDRALAIAIELRHSPYDCFYIALAEQRDCQMLTADERLVARCSGTPFAKRVRSLTARSNRRR
jgi:predicted nucleic acid-binding protein